MPSTSIELGNWNHYINGVFDDSTGSWESSTDSRYKGFWTTTSDWDIGAAGTADAYLDSNENGFWDSSDEKIGEAAGFWNGNYAGGTWNRYEWLKDGYFDGSAFGVFRINAEIDFNTSDNDDLIAGTELSDSIYLQAGDDHAFASNGNDIVHGGDGHDIIDGGAGNDTLIGGFAAFKDEIFGGTGHDFLGGGGGPDKLYGQIGKDELRAGHGKDYLHGGEGSDILYGGGGGNIFASELDGSVDDLFILSDFRGHGHDWGRNHGGINADVIQELDTDDRITILGTTDSDLSFRDVVAGTHNQSQAGIGIFDGEMLEAICLGSNLDANQLDSITGADPSRFW